MKSNNSLAGWPLLAATALFSTIILTTVYPNLASAQAEVLDQGIPAQGESRQTGAVVETVLRNGQVVLQRSGPDVAGGEWMYREEKLTTFQAITYLIRMIDSDHKTLINLISDLGGEPDIEKLKSSLRNIKFAPMDEVVSRNSSGYREHKQVEYEPSTNSVIALKPFFRDFAKLTVTGESWQNLPLKLIELLAIEASHSQKLGLTAETTLTQSYTFAKHLFNNSLSLLKNSTFFCGKYGDYKTRASDCAWWGKSFVMWPPRRAVAISFVASTSRWGTPTHTGIYYEPVTNLKFMHIELGTQLSEQPSREAALKTCEGWRAQVNIGEKSRLGTVDELFRYNPDAKKHRDYFLTDDVPGVVDLDTKAPAANLKYRDCHWLSGCDGGNFTVKTMCVFE